MNRVADNFHFPDEAIAIQGRVVRHPWMAAALAAVAQPSRPATLIEVGSWAGSSCATWCEALARFAGRPSRLLCVDAWENYLTERDRQHENPAYGIMEGYLVDGRIMPIFLHNAGVASRRFAVEVSLLRGRSQRVLDLLQERAFDLVYIDGSHLYADAVVDVRLAKRLVREGGILCGDDLEAQLGEVPHDVLMSGRDADLIRVDGIGNVHAGVSLAVAEEIGPVSVENGFWFMRRQGDAFRPIELDTSTAFVPGHFGARERGFIRADILAGKSRLPLAILEEPSPPGLETSLTARR